MIFELTGGRIGDRLVNNDMLLLTTTRARTGAPHTVPLLYLEDADDMVVFASYGGRANHPQWYLNLVANPLVVVQVGTTAREAMARTTHGSERARLWERAVSAYHGYGEYQQKTVREIPVVVLHPL